MVSSVITVMFCCIFMLIMVVCDTGARFTKYHDDNLTIMPKLRSTYNGLLIYKISYEGHEAFLRYTCNSVRKLACDIHKRNLSRL